MEYNGYILPIEYWKRINLAFNDIQPYYLASSFGRIYSEKSNIYLKPNVNTNGYLGIMLRDIYGNYKQFRIHRLIMILFNPVDKYEELQVNHIDGNKQMDCLQNLEWCNASENANHAFLSGLNKIGEDHPNSILTNDQVIFISERIMHNTPYNQIILELKNKYNGIPDTIYDRIHEIHKKYRWSKITRNYEFPKYNGSSGYSCISLDQINIICQSLQNGENKYIKIIEKLGIDTSSISINEINCLRSLISSIKTKKNYTNISKNYNF